LKKTLNSQGWLEDEELETSGAFTWLGSFCGGASTQPNYLTPQDKAKFFVVGTIFENGEPTLQDLIDMW